jgi:electron transport complex protein RnfD
VTIPYWCIIIGDFFAIIVVKQLFGGIGTNIVNPALAGRAFMFSWPALMSTWVKVGFENSAGVVSATDAVTAATPLAAMHQGQMPADSILNMFLGNVGGCIGETSAALLLIGFVYLLARRVLSGAVTFSFLGTVALLTLLFPRGNDPLLWCAAQLCSGGVMLGAIFMATDYVTSPVTQLGQFLYGVGCGLLTVLIRYFGGYPEGVSYAILVMNCTVVLFDRIGRPSKFGMPKKEAA